MAWRTPKDYFNKLHEKLPVYPLTNDDNFTHPSLSGVANNIVYNGGEKLLIPYYIDKGNGDFQLIADIPEYWFGYNWNLGLSQFESGLFGPYSGWLKVIDFDTSIECKENYPYKSDEFITSTVYAKYQKLLDVPTTDYDIFGSESEVNFENTLFTQDLQKAMINGRYIKNVYNKDNFVGNITSFNGTEYTVDEFFEKFGDYLVVVREKDGELCYSVDSNYGTNEDYDINSLVIPSIILPITSSNQIVYNNSVDEGYKYFIPYSVSSTKLQYNFLKNFSYQRSYTDLGIICCNVGPINISPAEATSKDYGVTLTDNIIEEYYEYENYDGGNYIYKNYSNYSLIGDKLKTGYIKDFGSYKVESTWEQKIHNCDLYYEKDYEVYDRVFTFNYKTGKDDAVKIFQKQYTPMSICVFNQRDIEEYLRAFNVPYIYRYPDVLPLDWPEDFVVRKVRRDALANKSLNLNVEKIRREALANKEKVLSVNKVRRK